MKDSMVRKVVDFHSSSSESESEPEYSFTPIKNDETDNLTQSLFKQLEEGAKHYTNILFTIKSGANLQAKKTDDDFEGCYPIHIAARLLGYNTGAVDEILQSFWSYCKRRLAKFNGLTDENSSCI